MLSVRGAGGRSGTSRESVFPDKLTGAENDEISAPVRFNSCFRRKQPQKMIVTSEEIAAFFRLFGELLVFGKAIFQGYLQEWGTN